MRGGPRFTPFQEALLFTQLEKVFRKKELARVVALTGAHFVVNFFTLYKLIHFVYALIQLNIKKGLT